MTPQSLLASQTGLSPYLRFGCLSTRLFYHQLTGTHNTMLTCPSHSLSLSPPPPPLTLAAPIRSHNNDDDKDNIITLHVMQHGGTCRRFARYYYYYARNAGRFLLMAVIAKADSWPITFSIFQIYIRKSKKLNRRFRCTANCCGANFSIVPQRKMKISIKWKVIRFVYKYHGTEILRHLPNGRT